MATTTSVKLDDEQKQVLQELADADDRSVHYLIRKAVSEFIEREQARRAFLADARASALEHDHGGGGMTIARARKHLKKPESKAAR